MCPPVLDTACISIKITKRFQQLFVLTTRYSLDDAGQPKVSVPATNQIPRFPNRGPLTPEILLREYKREDRKVSSHVISYVAFTTTYCSVYFFLIASFSKIQNFYTKVQAIKSLQNIIILCFLFQYSSSLSFVRGTDSFQYRLESRFA